VDFLICSSKIHEFGVASLPEGTSAVSVDAALLKSCAM
jgi:hypothetical protein